jgi:moderate conductance mechanosensitive channel
MRRTAPSRGAASPTGADPGVDVSVLDELWRTGAVSKALAIAAIVVGARVLRLFARAVLRRWLDPERHGTERRAQVRTLLAVIDSLVAYLIYFTAFSMILTELDRDIRPLLASASVIGLAFALAGQQFVRDVIGGFLLIFEGVVQVGDVITVGDVTGEVERISLRVTQIRKYTGELVTIPNGQIQQVGNMNRGFMRAIIQVGVANEVDVRRAMEIIHEVGTAWAREHPNDVLSPPEVQGVMQLGADQTTIRLVIKLTPAAVALAERDLRLRIKDAFGAAGLDMWSASRVMNLATTPPHGALTSQT